MNEKYQSSESMRMMFDVTTIRQMTDAAKYEKIKNEIYCAARNGEENYTVTNLPWKEAQEVMQYFKAKGFNVEELTGDSLVYLSVKISWGR